MLSESSTADVKTCRVCGVSKPLDDFYRERSTGHKRECKVCSRAARNAWRAANGDRVRATNKRSYRKNSAERIKRARDYYFANRAKKLAYMKAYDAVRKKDPGYKAAKQAAHAARRESKRAARAAQEAADREHAEKLAAAEAYIANRLKEIEEASNRPKPERKHDPKTLENRTQSAGGISVGSFHQ